MIRSAVLCGLTPHEVTISTTQGCPGSGITITGLGTVEEAELMALRITEALLASPRGMGCDTFGKPLGDVLVTIEGMPAAGDVSYSPLDLAVAVAVVHPGVRPAGAYILGSLAPDGQFRNEEPCSDRRIACLLSKLGPGAAAIVPTSFHEEALDASIRGVEVYTAGSLGDVLCSDCEAVKPEAELVPTRPRALVFKGIVLGIGADEASARREASEATGLGAYIPASATFVEATHEALRGWGRSEVALVDGVVDVVLRDGAQVPLGSRRRETYLAMLVRSVACGELSVSASVVLTYQYDHPGVMLEEAAATCGVPAAVVQELDEKDRL